MARPNTVHIPLDSGIACGTDSLTASVSADQICKRCLQVIQRTRIDFSEVPLSELDHELKRRGYEMKPIERKIRTIIPPVDRHCSRCGARPGQDHERGCRLKEYDVRG